MPLRRSPALTPGSLAARRANALKSTGPRSPRGKARVSLNALKHGRAMGPAGRAARFRERLLRAGYPCQEALYGGLRSCLAQALGARAPYWRRQADWFAAQAWCVAVGRDFFRTKLESPLDSVAKSSRVLAQDPREARMRSLRRPPGFARTLRYRAEDKYRRIGVALWIQRRRYLTAARVKRIMAGFERFRIEEAAADAGLESRVRCLVFRLRRPGYFERMSYGLDRNGDPDWSREPWRSMPGYREQWEAARRLNAAHTNSPVDGDSGSQPWTPAYAGVTPPEQRAASALVIPAKSGIHDFPTGSVGGDEGRVVQRICNAVSRVIAGVSRWVSSHRDRRCELAQ